ncbi:acetyl-CoA synthetase-like protein [Gigaspora margarita]|uniref:Acetyl-CoA synthetase-like protein n=1 Tax=Gigaspora margarita TaxID=4874 RepID=A0A8H4EKJ4_GIGMA|nr:acetyl-CoA synthetase-like protein [Gigaspora margarita]
MIFESKYPDVRIPNVGIYQYVTANQNKISDDKIIFVDGITDEKATFGELKRNSRRFAAGLQDEIGFKHHDVLGLISPNHIDYPVVVFGVLAAGGKVTTVNPKCTASEIAFQLNDSGVSVIIVHPECLNTVIKAAKEANISESRVFLLGDREIHGFRPHRSLIGDRETDPASYSPEEAKNTTAFICYSSGTTGRQKGVEITHTNVIASIMQIIPFSSFKTRNIFIGVLPFFHIYGLVFIVNLVPVLGASAIILSSFNLTTFCRCIQNHKVNFIYAVPPIILALVKSPSIESMSSVETVFSGAAPLSKGLIDDFYNLYKIPIQQGYGLTETSAIITLSEEERIVSGSCGILIPNLQVKILSKDEHELGYDEPGELCVRGPSIMKGYLNNKEATDATMDIDGFLHTGDVAVVDRQGNFFIVDRVKELIKYKGFQVAPAELDYFKNFKTLSPKGSRNWFEKWLKSFTDGAG